MRKNDFETRTYDLREFGSKEEMLKHLEYKISAVVKEHTPYWKITNIERKITDTSAKAIIHMERD
jgi:hypothetical protein